MSQEASRDKDQEIIDAGEDLARANEGYFRRTMRMHASRDPGVLQAHLFLLGDQPGEGMGSLEPSQRAYLVDLARLGMGAAIADMTAFLKDQKRAERSRLQ